MIAIHVTIDCDTCGVQESLEPYEVANFTNVEKCWAIDPDDIPMGWGVEEELTYCPKCLSEQ